MKCQCHDASLLSKTHGIANIAEPESSSYLLLLDSIAFADFLACVREVRQFLCE